MGIKRDKHKSSEALIVIFLFNCYYHLCHHQATASILVQTPSQPPLSLTEVASEAVF